MLYTILVLPISQAVTVATNPVIVVGAGAATTLSLHKQGLNVFLIDRYKRQSWFWSNDIVSVRVAVAPAANTKLARVKSCNLLSIASSTIPLLLVSSYKLTFRSPVYETVAVVAFCTTYCIVTFSLLPSATELSCTFLITKSALSKGIATSPRLIVVSTTTGGQVIPD